MSASRFFVRSRVTRRGDARARCGVHRDRCLWAETTMMMPSALLLLMLVSIVAMVLLIYRGEMRAARTRLRNRSSVLASPYGDLEYAEGGAGADVLIVHGAAGGWDQGALIAAAAGWAHHGDRRANADRAREGRRAAALSQRDLCRGEHSARTTALVRRRRTPGRGDGAQIDPRRRRAAHPRSLHGGAR